MICANDSYCKCALCNYISLYDISTTWNSLYVIAHKNLQKIKTFQSLQKVLGNFIDSWKRNPHGMSFDCEPYNSE